MAKRSMRVYGAIGGMMMAAGVAITVVSVTVVVRAITSVLN